MCRVKRCGTPFDFYMGWMLRFGRNGPPKWMFIHLGGAIDVCLHRSSSLSKMPKQLPTWPQSLQLLKPEDEEEVLLPRSMLSCMRCTKMTPPHDSTPCIYLCVYMCVYIYIYNWGTGPRQFFACTPPPSPDRP